MTEILDEDGDVDRKYQIELSELTSRDQRNAEILGHLGYASLVEGHGLRLRSAGDVPPWVGEALAVRFLSFWG
jgi:hypothetical protein